MQGSPNNVVTDITNAVADRVLTVGTVTDEQQDLNGEANLTFDGSTLTVAGNLTVTGTTTTLSTTNTIISDKLLELANGTTGTPSGDAGLIIERGDSTNAGIIWDESRDEFVVCTTSATGATTGDLTFTPANLSVERIGAGTEQAEAEVHAKRDTASGVQYSTTATVIAEDDTRPSIQLAGAASNIGLIQFGDNAAVASGQVYYDHSTDKLRIDCGGNTDRLTIDASGNAVVNNTVTCAGVELADAASVSISAPLLPTTDHTATGLTAEMLAGGAIGAFQTVCIHTTTQEVVISDSNAVGTMPVIGIAPAAISDTATGTILLQGFIRDDTWAWTTGGILYASETAGAMTHTAPTTSQAFVQALGIALSPDVVYFNPSLTLVEVA